MRVCVCVSVLSYLRNTLIDHSLVLQEVLVQLHLVEELRVLSVDRFQLDRYLNVILDIHTLEDLSESARSQLSSELEEFTNFQFHFVSHKLFVGRPSLQLNDVHANQQTQVSSWSRRDAARAHTYILYYPFLSNVPPPYLYSFCTRRRLPF